MIKQIKNVSHTINTQKHIKTQHQQPNKNTKTKTQQQKQNENNIKSNTL